MTIEEAGNSSAEFEFSLPSRVMLGGSMSIFAIVAVLGNTMFWCALIVDHKAKTTSNAFLINLSLSDWIVGCWNMPITVLSVGANCWLLGDALCAFSAFVDNTMLLISVWTVAASSIDKFYMVQYPLNYHRSITWNRVTGLILMIWLIAGCANAPPLFQHEGLTFGYSYYSFSCGLDCGASQFGQVYCLVYTVFFVPIPLLIITFCYVKIFTIAKSINRKDKALVRDLGQQERASGPSHRPSSDPALQKKRQHRSHTMTVLVIIGVMFSCLVPIVLVGLISFIDNSFSISIHLVVAFHWLLLANSAVNPVLYGIVNPFFRRAYIKLLVKLKSVMCSGIGDRCRRRVSSLDTNRPTLK